MTVGVAVLSDGAEILRNGRKSFPMMSVFKVHVALAVLEKMNRQGTSLDSMVYIKKERLLPRTYSPLRDKFPGQDVSISIRDLLRYCVSRSDNNACDILIGYAGGVSVVNDYVRKLGVNARITETEESMHRDIRNQRRNRSTPLEIAELLRMADRENLFTPVYCDFFRQALLQTTTGRDKLRAGLSSDVAVGHKTGSSDRLPSGVKIGDNDAGFVVMPDGKCYYIVVLIKKSREADRDNAAVIAAISRIVYEKMFAGK